MNIKIYQIQRKVTCWRWINEYKNSIINSSIFLPSRNIISSWYTDWIKWWTDCSWIPSCEYLIAVINMIPPIKQRILRYSSLYDSLLIGKGRLWNREW